jgi:sporulation related protein
MNMPNDFFARRLAAIEQEETRCLAAIEEEKAPHTPADKGWREETASDGYDEPTRLPLAPQLYQNEIPHVRRSSRRALVMALFGLAVAGAAGAFGYRDMFVGSVPYEPNRIASATNVPQAKSIDNESQADTAITGSIENLVSREKKPVIIEPPKPPTPPVAGRGMPNQAMPRRVAAAADTPWPPPAATDPSKRVGQTSAADAMAESNRAHLVATPIAPDNASSTALVTASVLGGGYAIQVLSERSESRAQAAFRLLQAKYPIQLGSRQPIIRRADLGAMGTYYRTLVGPFASAEKATRFCGELKTAGGNCIIQKY